MIRAKFTVTQITHYEAPGCIHVELSPRYSKQIPEDKCFAKYTPNGKLMLDVTNPAVIEQFKPGKVFYIDLTEAPDGTPSGHE